MSLFARPALRKSLPLRSPPVAQRLASTAVASPADGALTQQPVAAPGSNAADAENDNDFSSFSTEDAPTSEVAKFNPIAKARERKVQLPSSRCAQTNTISHTPLDTNIVPSQLQVPLPSLLPRAPPPYSATSAMGPNQSSLRSRPLLPSPSQTDLRRHSLRRPHDAVLRACP